MPRNIRLLYVHNFLTDFCPHWPFMVIYFANIAGSYTVAMSVMAVETLAAALFDIPTGMFSDHMGRRVTMACGSLSMALSLACYAWADNVGMLYGGAILTGLGQCLFSGNNNALLYESLQSDGLQSEYHHYCGRARSMFQLALCSSAFLSIWLSHYGLRTAFLVAVVPQILGVFVSLLFQEPRLHTQSRPKGLALLKDACLKTWRNPHLFWLVVARGINYGADEAKFKSQNAYISTLWPLWAIGLGRGLGHAMSFIGFRLSGRLIERFGESHVFVARDLYWLFTGTGAVILNNVLSPMLMLTGSVLFGPAEVASDHLMQKEFTDEQRATMGSISSFFSSIIFAIVALGVGVVSDHFGLAMGLVLAILVRFLSLPVNLWLFRKRFGW